MIMLSFPVTVRAVCGSLGGGDDVDNVLCFWCFVLLLVNKFLYGGVVNSDVASKVTSEHMQRCLVQ